MVLLKIHDLSGKSVLLTQQRDLSGDLGWTQAIAGENIEESKIDDYITRAVKRDPDLWVIEIEDRALNNPFEGKIF